MRNAPTNSELDDLRQSLQQESPLPQQSDAEQRLICYSHTFRNVDKALLFATGILLKQGESLVGGKTQDSIGDLFWLGVQVSNLEQWQANGGFHRLARNNPETSTQGML